MENIVIPAQKRQSAGTKGAADIRREGLIPAIIYGGNTSTAVSVKLHDVRNVIYSPDFHRVDVDVEGTKISCILKEVQFNPVTDTVSHIDFLQLEEGKKVKVEVPIHFKGVSVGIKAGGKLIQKVRKIKIKAAPENLVSEVSMDVTNMKLGQSLRVRDIHVDKGVEILNAPGIPVVSVLIPRVLKAEEPVAVAATTEVTPGAEAAPGAKAAAPAAEGAKKAEAPKK